MPFAILRFAKCRGGTVTAMEKHHERQKESYNSNRDIDPARTPQNYHIKVPDSRYYHEVQGRIEAAQCRVRRDSVKMVDAFIGGTNSFLTALPPAEQRAYFQLAYAFIAERVGEENIFSAVIHMDEKTPHMHLCFVPLTKDKRLSAKEVLGNRLDMVRWQDEFYEHMSLGWPALERGQPAAETRREHIPIQVFKQAQRLDGEAQRIRNALDSVTAFNVGKKRTEAMEILREWLPSAESFTAQIKSVDKYINELETAASGSADKLRTLEETASEKGAKLTMTNVEIKRLQAQLKKQKALLDQVPPDVLAALRGKNGKVR